MKDAPDALNKIVDKVLAYRPKPVSKGAIKREELQKNIADKAKSESKT
jgi:hypothetical protein